MLLTSDKIKKVKIHYGILFDTANFRNYYKINK